jgi:quercetin dioxygenase-like cupin family protein
MKTTAALPFAISFLCLLPFAAIPAQTQASPHILAAPEDANWRPTTMLPAGTQVAVLTGDPTKPGPFAVRLKFPAHFSIPAHWHPADEHVIVTSGTLTFGMGDKLDRTAATNKTLTTGGFAVMPATMHHFAFTGDQETTVVMYADGPLRINYINPADDPRLNKSPAPAK